MELIGTMPQSIYKKRHVIMCCGFTIKHTVSKMLPSPQCEPVLPRQGLAAEAGGRG